MGKTDEAWAEDCTTAHMMGYADAEGAARAKVERLEARIAEFRGFVGLVLEYCEKGTPYWYGEDLKTRARKLLKEGE
jgi:hypothetical protein